MINYDEFKIIMEDDNITIILDANILLDLYRLSTNASKDILNLLDQIKDKIWVPKQAYEEYYKNKDGEKSKQHNKYKNIKSELNNPIQKMDSEIKKKLHRYRKFNFPNITDLENGYKNKVDEVKNIIGEYINSLDEEIQNNKKLLREDKVKEYIKAMNDDGKVGKGIDIVEKIEIVKEGGIRYKYEIPPGYKDLDTKEGISVFGDLYYFYFLKSER